MTIDDLLKDARVIRVPTSFEHMREVIERRIRYVEQLTGREKDSLFRITDGAYQAISVVTQDSCGLALLVLKRVFESLETPQELPQTIEERHVKALGFTYESLLKHYESPLGNAAIIDFGDGER